MSEGNNEIASAPTTQLSPDATPHQNKFDKANQPTGESAPSQTFAERAAERLRVEKTPSQPEQQVIEPNEEVKPDAHQSETEPPAELQTQSNPGELSQEVDNSDVESMDSELDVTGLRQRADDAEALVTSMQGDYTRKTQKLAEARRELLDNLETSKRVAGVYADRAASNLKRYDNVNWKQLQSTLDPAVYAKRVAEYRRAVQMRDRATGEHEQIVKFADGQAETQKQYQADISKEILVSTLPGWGNELYGSLRDHATNALDFSPDEFDAITDHRWIKLIHNDMKMGTASQHVKNIQQSNSSRAPGGPNKERPRGADGRYKTAQQNHLDNPGDRSATRVAFRERLAAEGRGG